MIKIRDLQFRWGPHAPLVLEIATLDVAAGEAVFIKGPSGSGKSTLLNVIGGVLEPTDGTVEVLGNSLGELSAKERDRIRGDEMGFVFQQFNLLPYLSVLQNVLLPLKFSSSKLAKISESGRSAEGEAQRLLQELGLPVDRILNRPVTQLSVGQQQRVAAARALLGWPGLVIADEPTSALDADSRQKFVRLLFEECRRLKATLVFVSHDGSLASMFDRAIDLTVVNSAFRAGELV